MTPQQLIYGVDDRPPFFRSTVFAIQHILIMSTSLLFPAIVAAAVGSRLSLAQATQLTTATMLAMAIGTFLLQFRGRWFGAGYLCPAICEPAYLATAIYAILHGGLPLLFGMGLLAGCFEIMVSFGLRYAKKLIPTEVTGVVVMMIGINLIAPDIRSAFHMVDNNAAIIPFNAVFLFSLTLISLIIIGVWGGKKFQLYSVVLAAVIGYAAALLTHHFPAIYMQSIRSSALFALPHFSHFFDFNFSFSMILPFFVGAFSASIKAVGNITTAQKITDDEWIRPDLKSIKNAVFTDGVATMISSSIGGMPMGTSSSNVAYTLPSQCASRIINIFISALLLILAFIPKAALALVYMPAPVRGALLAYVICFMIVAGLQIVVSRMLDLRKTLVIGLSLSLGLMISFVPQVFQQLPLWAQPIFNSSLSTAAISVFVLNLLFRLGIKRKVQLSFDLMERNNQKIRKFFDKYGRQWGALPDQIKKAQAAAIECLHALQLFQLEHKHVELHVSYDEYCLALNFIYKGALLPMDNNPLNLKEADFTQAQAMNLAVYMMTIEATKVKCTDKNGSCNVCLEFKT